MLERGYVQVYTGNGKGKTTAALGLAVRAAGNGLRVLFLQFMKGGGPYGEHISGSKLAPNLIFERTGRAGWVDREHPEEDARLAREALARGEEAVISGDFDLVVLDEVIGAIGFGLLTVDEVLAVVDRKPPGVELVLTGRNADQRIIDAADLVTEMREIKHYYRQGVPARTGIEK